MSQTSLTNLRDINITPIMYTKIIAKTAIKTQIVFIYVIFKNYFQFLKGISKIVELTTQN